MKRLGFPQLFGENVVVFWHTREPGGCQGHRLHLGNGHVEKGTRRRHPVRHQEPHPRRGQPGPARLSLKTHRGPRCPCPFPQHAWNVPPPPEAETRRLQRQTTSPRVALVPTGHPGGCGARPIRPRTAHAPAGRAGGRPRSLAPARSPWQRARGGRGRAAAAAISAASCSSRPRRHGNRVTQLGRLPARLARVTPAARAPSSPSRTLPGARGRQGGRLMGDAY